MALVLTNAIYFKSKWELEFHSGATRDEPFTLLSGSKVNVAMMHQSAPGGYTEGGDFQALELPYVHGAASMIIILPRKADGLPALEEALTGERLAKLLSELHWLEAEVSLPRFTIASQASIEPALMSLGMTDAFDPKAADFSGMVARGGIWIAAVLQKAFVDVNEVGTEAAAATAVGEVKSALGEGPSAVFRADHPFLFLIRDRKSRTILFMGRLMNPKE
jgi:serpin B